MLLWNVGHRNNSYSLHSKDGEVHSIDNLKDNLAYKWSFIRNDIRNVPYHVHRKETFFMYRNRENYI